MSHNAKIFFLNTITSEIKQTFVHSFIYVSGNFISRALSFLLLPIYTRVLTPRDYGMVALLDVFSEIVIMLASFVLRDTIFYFFHRAKSDEEKSSIFSSSLFVVLSLVLTLVIASYKIGEIISSLLFKTDQHARLITVWCYALLFQLPAEVPLTYFRANNRSVLYNGTMISQTLLSILCNLVFVVYLRHGVTGVAESLICSYAIIGGVATFLMFRTVKPSFSFPMVKTMFRYAAPLMLGRSIILAGSTVDKLLLQRLAGLTDVGLYSLGWRFADTSRAFAWQPFRLYWQSKVFELSHAENGRCVIALVFTYITLIMLFIALAISVVSVDLIRLMAEATFGPAYYVVPILGLGFIFWCARMFFNFHLLFTGTTKIVPIMDFVHVALLVLFSFILVPLFAYKGSAWAFLASSCSSCAIMYMVAQRKYKVNFEWRRLAILFVSGALAFFLTMPVSIKSTLLSIAIRLVIAVLCFAGAVYFMGFLSESEKYQARQLLRWCRDVVKRRYLLRDKATPESADI